MARSSEEEGRYKKYVRSRYINDVLAAVCAVGAVAGFTSGIGFVYVIAAIDLAAGFLYVDEAIKSARKAARIASA